MNGVAIDRHLLKQVRDEMRTALRRFHGASVDATSHAIALQQLILQLDALLKH